ncbi:hypothetical protein ABBQ32_000352 [Trebouxia sp. C0010 RCD-2024]
MGAGRRTSTYDIDTGAQQLGFVERQRQLGENLGGVIFGCSHETYDECVNGLIFGLPRPHICYVQYIVPGMPVFLYNYSDRTMHGIFKAVSEGSLEINPRGWTTFPNQRTQYPAQVRVEVYNQCPALSEREFRPILKDCYSQDTSQSSRLQFELKKSEAQNLCRAFNNASARVNLGAATARTVSPAVASNSKAAAVSSSSIAEPANTEELFPALGSEWQQVSKKKGREPFDPNAPSAGGAWARTPSTPPKPPPAPAAEPTAVAPRPPDQQPPQERSNRTINTNGLARSSEELRADPNALANGAFDAPSKPNKGRKAEAVPGGPSSSDVAVAGTQQPISAQQARQPSNLADLPDMNADIGQAPNQLVSTSRTGQGPGRRPGPFGDRAGPFGDRAGLDWPSSPPPEYSQQRASELVQLRDALQSLPPSVAEAINRHVSCTNEALQKAESERRAMARSLSAAHNQLAVLPQLQVEQRKLREGAAAMAAELVTLRHHMAHLTSPTPLPNGLPPRRPSPNGMGAAARMSPDPADLLPAAISGSLGMKGLPGQELYLSGGNDGVSWLDAVEVYIPSRGQWATSEPMPLERGYGAAAAIGRQMFVMGGGNGSSWLQSVMMCNLETGAWLEVASMEYVRGSLAAVALDNKLYAMGGGQPNVNRDTTEIYDAHHNAWLPGPTMNQRRFTTAAALHNSSIFVSGGYDGTQYLRSVERLDPREGKWQMVAEMNQKRGSHASTVALGHVFALGGWDANTFLDSTEIYETRMDSWRYIASMEASRAYGAAVTVDGNVYALGGMRDAHHNEVVERYDGAKDCWHKIIPPSHILQKRAFLAACVVDLG